MNRWLSPPAILRCPSGAIGKDAIPGGGVFFRTDAGHLRLSERGSERASHSRVELPILGQEGEELLVFVLGNCVWGEGPERAFFRKGVGEEFVEGTGEELIVPVALGDERVFLSTIVEAELGAGAILGKRDDAAEGGAALVELGQ